MRAGFCLFVFVVAVSGGCADIPFRSTTWISGDLDVDGGPFRPYECRTGAHYGFEGVELADANGRRIRASVGPRIGKSYPSPSAQGGATVAVLEPGESRAERISPCGVLNVATEAKKIGGYRNVHGSADFSCASPQHSVKGHVEFGDCH